jgi:predicted RNA-binding Zn-ribbon protein involved in translation (DUF1610 family)
VLGSSGWTPRTSRELVAWSGYEHDSLIRFSPTLSPIGEKTKCAGKHLWALPGIPDHSPDDQGESSLTLTRSKSVNVNDGVNDDPGKPKNPHQNCEKALHTCVVCGQALLQVSGQATRYCSTACRVKAYRQRWSSADTPGHGEPDPPAVEVAESGPPDPSVCLDCGKRIDAEGFQYRCPACLKALYDRLQRPYPEKLVRCLEQQHGYRSPDDTPGDAPSDQPGSSPITGHYR